ncbi:MAG: FtsX-like permease family protein, partial [Thiothrix sp.]|nr:FtsX-like permease family protein [Thiothrix sp.]
TLLLLASLRTDLIGRWQDSLPVDAPNYFMINIQPGERAGLEQFLAEQKLKAELFPMIRGRLTLINGEPVTVDQYEDPRSRRLLEREFNLSELVALPDSNRLLAGEWFPQAGAPGLTVEEGIAASLRFGLGDRLTFDVAGQVFEEPVTSIREVRWDSMEPNFFVAASGGALEKMPRTFITSLYIPPGQEDSISRLVQNFPGVTVIDTGAILAQVRELVGQATFAVQGIFLFTLVAGVVVLFAALQSQRPERRQELAVLKSLGAGHRLLRRRIWLEFLLLGALAGLLAGLLAMLGSNLAGIYLFSLDVRLNPLLLLAGTLSGALLVGAAAWFNLRSLLDTAPMALFRG